jgi:uncharacterized protein YbaA (DUF1428 family)
MYVDGFVIAVPAANKDAFIKMAREFDPVFIEHGALKVVECWGDDVPDGKLTSFPMAVKLEPGEVVVFSWIIWPSKEARDKGNEAVMKDPRMQTPPNPPVFDGKRMIFGGFEMIVEM